MRFDASSSHDHTFVRHQEYAELKDAPRLSPIHSCEHCIDRFDCKARFAKMNVPSVSI